MARGAWWATVQGIAKGQTQLSTHEEETKLSLFADGMNVYVENSKESMNC